MTWTIGKWVWNRGSGQIPLLRQKENNSWKLERPTLGKEEL